MRGIEPATVAPEDAVDLDRYPLLDPEGRAGVIAEARRTLADNGTAILPGFLRPEAVTTMAATTERSSAPPSGLQTASGAGC